MIDGRFFGKKSSITMKRICEILKIEVPRHCPPTKKISNIARMNDASANDITFFHNAKYIKGLEGTNAFACLISEKHVNSVPKATIPLIVRDPYLSYAILLKEFYFIKNTNIRHSISKKASIAKTAIIEDGCHVSDFSVISDDVVIRGGTFIGEHVTVLNGVQIGENSYIESHVTIGFALVGKSVYIKSGAKIGQQGFGFHVGEAGITDVLQVGRVIIGDDVQIGANCTIDRGSIGDTRIGNNVRLDNLIHIAHNVEIGDYCVIAAQTGIAGSTKIGNRCFLGGQVGIAGHILIGDDVNIAAQSGIMQNIPLKGKVAGTPAINVTNWHRQTIAVRKLAEKRKSSELQNFLMKLKKFFHGTLRVFLKIPKEP
ncbi:MAG: UDP-3-O-(3-hydroxymyristoyl)glucosamine N-acyltransferase [Holosporales bacterium]|jgi:UDP-3-O-[3-hydroxymyristoyl] glucosamine N-acyltransferase|nr:UDP-3-O-(3-hydroxymyristoyl)glucosamine N-acyltransferase [Holosporales bacterium]